MQTIDLHGQTWAEALPEFIELYNEALRQSDGELDVVHGYGSTGVGGVLRDRLRGFLHQHEERLDFIPGENMDGNPGHTKVIAEDPLPGMEVLLAEQIWDYCEQQPKARSKIMGRFRRHGQPKIKQAISVLEKQGRLRSQRRGRLTMYEAVVPRRRSAGA